PLQAGLKDRSPSRRAHEASVSWPPRNRTERYLFIRQDPSTSWVVASGRRRTRAPVLAHPAGFRPVAAPGGFTFPPESGGLDPQRLRAQPASNGCPHRAGSLSLAEDGGLDPQTDGRPARLPAGGRAPTASSSAAESGAIEAHGRSRALVSSEARDLPGSLSLPCVPPQGFEP